ncbi:crotonase/enoyl-CoA hydratase family protein [Novosphingobium mangrovi (ex Huang et al. 2023)]|uniref:Crotonase/enoyl-CoA hydratase family protein n=1 Tax=Novosphingobium mangrovi (ex Huang et al. 2023) TaxID=2976432 RepID=A0ABT2I777_9SPHN|nr:crotonase/enoyl-CoA hydratase family protein [Novosphingobium mangrovi (ex Huang et al. 2023)]MCT2400657.1 crotonase/enoyl-CoA hydratase family protein [Novosphingobium mangrovi (ex Huang et al. 2023)]
MSEEVLVAVRDGVLEVTINRPEARNAMTKSAAEAIAAAMDRLDAESDLRCAILTGAGGTFCSGMDLKGFLQGELPVDSRGGFGGLTTWTPKKPVIAAVDGFALAGGMELAFACDLIVAHAEAKFGIPEIKRGLVAAGGGAVQLPRLLPRPLAMELALTGDPIGARRALELGLVNRITEGPAIEGARELAGAIAANGPLAVVATKGIVRDSWLWPVEEINQHQNPYIAHIFTSEDAKEGARAFAEKRKPVWKGR